MTPGSFYRPRRGDWIAALGMGAMMALIWGRPPLILARRRELEGVKHD